MFSGHYKGIEKNKRKRKLFSCRYNVKKRIKEIRELFSCRYNVKKRIKERRELFSGRFKKKKRIKERRELFSGRFKKKKRIKERRELFSGPIRFSLSRADSYCKKNKFLPQTWFSILNKSHNLQVFRIRKKYLYNRNKTLLHRDKFTGILL